MYKAEWSPHIGKMLLCQPQFGNIMDPYVISIITEDEVVVGHIPEEFLLFVIFSSNKVGT